MVIRDNDKEMVIRLVWFEARMDEKRRGPKIKQYLLRI
jgi:hypothetical protein